MKIADSPKKSAKLPDGATKPIKNKQTKQNSTIQFFKSEKNVNFLHTEKNKVHYKKLALAGVSH